MISNLFSQSIIFVRCNNNNRLGAFEVPTLSPCTFSRWCSRSGNDKTHSILCAENPKLRLSKPHTLIQTGVSNCWQWVAKWISCGGNIHFISSKLFLMRHTFVVNWSIIISSSLRLLPTFTFLAVLPPTRFWVQLRATCAPFSLTLHAILKQFWNNKSNTKSTWVGI